MRLLTALNSLPFLVAFLFDITNAVRLMGGSRGSEGRLEVYHDGKWGTVCDDSFDVVDAMVACRTLGYTESVPEVKRFSSGSGQIWLDDVHCSGSESDLFQCPHRQPTGSNDCSHGEDVGIDCQPPVRARLVGGGRSSAGRVEVRIRGRWGTVCDDSFGTSDARVVCRMLGYTSQTPSVKSSAHYGRGSDPIWLDDVGCTGSEADILRCNLPLAIGSHNCAHGEDVGVDCQPSLVSSVIRLANVSRGSAGRVEVYANRQWGTVCDDYFDVYDARVACRMLGYTSERNPTYHDQAYYGRGVDPIWLDDLACRGTESSLFSCSHRGVGNENCGHNEDVGVDCRPPRGPTTVSIVGPPYYVASGSRSLSLLCKASSFSSSVSFTWSDVTCQSTTTSADFSICVFTLRSSGDHGNPINCTAINTDNTALSVSSLYTLRYPPTSAPVLNSSDTLGSLRVGSSVTLTCTVTGGTPTVSSVSVVCTNQGRSVTYTSFQTRGNSSVSRTISITNLQLEDDGTVCRCTGTWSTRPDLYTLSSSRTLRVFDPPTSAPVLNSPDTLGSLKVGSSVTLTCTITGGTPTVSSVSLVCTNQGRSVAFTSFQIRGNSSVSRTISITNLQLEDDRTVCRCTGTWSTRPDLYTLSYSRTLRVFDPPTSAPVLNSPDTLGSLKVGSSVTLTCTITGGTPTVSSVSLVCTNQGRSVAFTSFQIRGNSSVSRTIRLANLQLEDDRTVCRCTGTWSTRPDLYTLSSSRTLRVFDPPTSAPVLNSPDTLGSLKVSSSVTLTCTITGGTPTVSAVNVVCTNQGRTVTFNSFQTQGNSSVSRTIRLANLQLEDDGTVCRCTGNWSTRPDLYTLSSSRTLRVFDPPTQSPVLSDLSTVESLVAGSAINLTCTISGGTPPVSSVHIACTGPERTLTIISSQTQGSSSVSRTISIINLQLQDDGTVCRCTGTWSTRPDLYTLSSSRTLRVLDDAAPRVTSLTVNGAASSLTVTAGEKVPVTLNCTATGRPVPSFTLQRQDGRHLFMLPTHSYEPPTATASANSSVTMSISADATTVQASAPKTPSVPGGAADSSMAAVSSTVVVGLDERELQVELTRSPRCQDAAKYTCLANNRASVDTESIALFVNCPPSFAPDNETPGPQHPVTIQTGDNAETLASTVHLMVHPIPTLKRVVFYNTTNQNTNVSHEVDKELFRLLCEPLEALYLQACTISYASEDVPQPGDYELTIGNLFGDLSFRLKLEVPKAEAAKGENQNLPIYIGGGVGGGVVLLVVLLAVIFGVRRCKAEQPTNESPAPRRQASENPSYTDPCLASSSQAAQKTEDRENGTAEGGKVGAARYTGFPGTKKSPCRQSDAEQPTYESPALWHQASEDPSYTDLCLASSSQAAQKTEDRNNGTAEGGKVGAARYTGFPRTKKSPGQQNDGDAIYENAAMETDEPEDSPYMNVGDVAAGTSCGSRTGAVTMRGDSVIYQNTKFP